MTLQQRERIGSIIRSVVVIAIALICAVPLLRHRHQHVQKQRRDVHGPDWVTKDMEFRELHVCIRASAHCQRLQEHRSS
ncbi:MAG: hypothetical protein ACLUT3_00025 [Bifidobacterium bifidum]